jgi:hypothetical protein
MGWCTTSDLERFTAAAGGYLKSRAAENTPLLSAVQDAQSGGRAQAAGGEPGRAPAAGLLFGWWEPPDGRAPRGAFLHDPPVPLLISGPAPEMAAALAATLAKMNRHVVGVDGPTEAADAFAAAWSQRAGTVARVHHQRSVYRLADGRPAVAGGTASWLPPEASAPPGRLRVATAGDLSLLAGWLAAFAAETAERIGSPPEMAADLIVAGGAVFWEAPQRPAWIRDAAHHLTIPHRRETAPPPEPAYQPAALAALSRPVAGTVRIGMVYTPQDRRRNGYANAVTLAVSRALLSGGAPGVLGGPLARGRVHEIVMITDGARPDRWGSRLGYQLISERTVLRFGPVTGNPTGPLRRLQPTGPAPRLPTGPLPRLPRIRR